MVHARNLRDGLLFLNAIVLEHDLLKLDSTLIFPMGLAGVHSLTNFVNSSSNAGICNCLAQIYS